MGDGDHGGVAKLGLDAVLDEVVGEHVDVGRGLVQHQHLVLAQQRPRQTQQLLLAHREHLRDVGHVRQQLVGQLLHGLLQVRLRQHRPQFLLALGLERVQVLLDGALEQEGSLRDHRDVLSQRVQSHLQRVAPAQLVD